MAGRCSQARYSNSTRSSCCKGHLLRRSWGHSGTLPRLLPASAGSAHAPRTPLTPACCPSCRTGIRRHQGPRPSPAGGGWRRAGAATAWPVRAARAVMLQKAARWRRAPPGSARWRGLGAGTARVGRLGCRPRSCGAAWAGAAARCHRPNLTARPSGLGATGAAALPRRGGAAGPVAPLRGWHRPVLQGADLGRRWLHAGRWGAGLVPSNHQASPATTAIPRPSAAYLAAVPRVSGAAGSGGKGQGAGAGALDGGDGRRASRRRLATGAAGDLALLQGRARVRLLQAGGDARHLLARWALALALALAGSARALARLWLWLWLWLWLLALQELALAGSRSRSRSRSSSSTSTPPTAVVASRPRQRPHPEWCPARRSGLNRGIQQQIHPSEGLSGEGSSGPGGCRPRVGWAVHIKSKSSSSPVLGQEPGHWSGCRCRAVANAWPLPAELGTQLARRSTFRGSVAPAGHRSLW